MKRQMKKAAHYPVSRQSRADELGRGKNQTSRLIIV
jgi:hypothetical protein